RLRFAPSRFRRPTPSIITVWLTPPVRRSPRPETALSSDFAPRPSSPERSLQASQASRRENLSSILSLTVQARGLSGRRKSPTVVAFSFDGRALRTEHQAGRRGEQRGRLRCRAPPRPG